MSSQRNVRSTDTTDAQTTGATPRFEQPLSDDQIWMMLQTAANSARIMPIVKGDWKSSTRSYETREDAARALVFDLSFYANYRFSQVRRLFKQTAMRDVFTKAELDDIVEEAYFEQNGRSYPTFA
ncbi:hypothetical protein [Haloferax volcanii]|uniref:hypothetical protein n=1 Tax=Haloferax volcanii TaxID=2246 RepID=UPI0023DB2992|nr:hypothetical protein [Haloferax lucentense]WEL27468.1 hypothetical protein SVXHx_3260 [Haloferax lucentense]